MKPILPALLVLSSAVAVSAHFQLQFPAARGPFVEDDEPTFCDGFTNVTTNRTAFPLTGGVFTLRSEHPSWSAAVYLSTVQNPNNFDNFTQVKDPFQLAGEGIFCIPLDLASSPNATGLTNGQNVSIQILFNGGDGNLFQCADLTLSNSASVSSVSCTNATGTNSTGTNSTTTQSAALGTAAPLDMGLLGLLGVAVLIPLAL